MLSGSEIALAGLAALAAGFINSLAGGGTLISFPVLVALGIPEVAANVTNTVALCPGYLGGAIAQREGLSGQEKRLGFFLPAGIIGGIVGGMLLLYISADMFRFIVPFLILLASVLLAVQNRVREWIKRHAANGSKKAGITNTVLPVGFAAVYGGYFGAGLSVIVLAVLGLFIDDTLTRLNALKQCISLSINAAAAIFFIFSGMVVWPLAAVMAVSALAGGTIGGRVAGQINPDLLRWTVVGIGLIVGAILLIRLLV
jgi:uncharacterized membrane protein YfcA